MNKNISPFPLPNLEFETILQVLKGLTDPAAIAEMERFGINSEKALGIHYTCLYEIAKSIGKNHPLAIQLWETGIHEARILAAYIEDPAMIDEKQMDEWTQGFNSWDVCDLVTSELFDRTPFAYEKVFEYSQAQPEFVKRTGFVLIAALCVHDKSAPDEKFIQFLPVIQREAVDERNFVKKAVNWALRSIGKRNLTLNEKAIETTRIIHAMDSRSARWIATDAQRELTSEKIQQRLLKQAARGK